MLRCLHMHNIYLSFINIFLIRSIFIILLFIYSMDLDNLTNDISVEEVNNLKLLLQTNCGSKNVKDDIEQVDADDVNEADEAEVVNFTILKKMIIRWLKLDDVMKEKTKEIKELKDEKGQIEDKILAFMQHTEQDEIVAKDEKLKRTKSETKEKIDEEYIKKTLLVAMPGNIEAVDNLTNMLINSRATTQTYKLTRVGKNARAAKK